MARFTEIVCRTSIILFSLISLSLTLPIIERKMRGHGSTDAFYQQVQAAGKTVREHVPVAHLIHRKQDHLNFTSSSFADDIYKKLSDLQAKFEELSDQNEALRRRLDKKVNLNQDIDALVGKLGRILGEKYVGDALGKLADGAREEFGGDDGRMEEQINKVSEYLGNREAELASYVRNRSPSSSIPFLVNQLRQEPASNDTKAVIDFIAKYLIQLGNSAESNTDDSKNQISPGASKKEEFLNGSANVIRETELKPVRVSRAESASHSSNTDRVNASRKIAFSAAAIEPQYGVEGVAQAVQFQDVIENIGEDFLVSNHTFVCSVPGWYYFTYSLRTADGKYLGVLLMKNDDYVVGIYTDEDDRNTMETQSTVISLLAGDAVWLRLAPSPDFGLFSDKYRYSTFTGFLLFKE